MALCLPPAELGLRQQREPALPGGGAADQPHGESARAAHAAAPRCPGAVSLPLRGPRTSIPSARDTSVGPRVGAAVSCGWRRPPPPRHPRWRPLMANRLGRPTASEMTRGRLPVMRGPCVACRSRWGPPPPHPLLMGTPPSTHTGLPNGGDEALGHLCHDRDPHGPRGLLHRHRGGERGWPEVQGRQGQYPLSVVPSTGGSTGSEASEPCVCAIKGGEVWLRARVCHGWEVTVRSVRSSWRLGLGRPGRRRQQESFHP